MPDRAGLTAEELDLLDRVHAFTEREIIPTAPALDAADAYPEAIVEGLRSLGLFGMTISPSYGGLGHGLRAYSLAISELARGWMSVSGILNTHFIVSTMIASAGTDEQRARLLPRLASGELRAAFSMTEPHCGSDLAAITTTALRDGDGWLVSGEKRWQANGLRAGLIALLVLTDSAAEPRHRGMSCLLVEKTPGALREGGIEIPGLMSKLGYLGIDSTCMRLTQHRVPASALLGGVPGDGFRQMISAIELGRINVAARAVGVAQRAYELAMAYAHERRTFGVPIVEHQAIGFQLAEMATRIEAARLLVASAAAAKDAGRRSDVEAGMAKLFASEMCQEVVLAAMRIHGGNGYSKQYEIERLYRDAPMLLLGEGTSEIQKMIILRGLVRDWKDAHA